MNSIIKRNQVFGPFGHFFDNFFPSDLLDDNGFSSPFSEPSINVKESKDQYEMEVAAPGMNKDDFNVQVEGNLLTISAERKSAEKVLDKEGRYARREFNYHSFKRSFHLPSDLINADKIEANYDKGILHLVLPRHEAAKQQSSKTIAIH